ncbi:MAG: cyclase family protein [Steroidobacteraceae bacterium]
MKALRRFIYGLLALLVTTSVGALELQDYQIVDLSHAYDSKTLYWPSRPPMHFELQQLASGVTPGGWFYSANRVCTPEHGGTHLDAPIHFHERGQTAEQFPLDKLLAPAVRIDVTRQAQADRNYRLSRDEVLQFEKRVGRIKPGTIVLLHTGWSRFWPNREQYFGDASAEDASRLQFPSYGEEAARLLVEERQVAMLGVDTASIDYGRSKDFIVHRIAAARNVGGLENLTALESLPETGFTVIALPMKIAGGSGGPVRVVALVEKD